MQLAATSSATAQAITHLSDEKFATAKQISSLEEDCGYPLAPWGRWVVREGPGGGAGGAGGGRDVVSRARGFLDRVQHSP